MHSPDAFRRPSDAVVLDDLCAGLLVEGTAGDPPDDDVLREDHRAPDHLAFPAAVFTLPGEQVGDATVEVIRHEHWAPRNCAGKFARGTRPLRTPDTHERTGQSHAGKGAEDSLHPLR